MSCVEKRHMSHRMGSMLHHRFPNGFTDLFMDETDREVSTLTDRAFRSLCVGDDAVYNDELLYGYSPFSCHKPLAGDPLKKANRKESKKQGHSKSNKSYAQHQKSMSNMSSFLKALSATEESCEGMFIKNGAPDGKGESWDKSALRSIQRELSEFSSDYHSNLKDNQALPRKSSKTANGKSAVNIRKLNIKNFFLHSEFSPFQAWADFNRFEFGQKDSVLPIDDIPKWFDMPFYKEIREAHRKETLCSEETQPSHKVAAEPPPPTAPKPKPPSPPPVLPKASTTPTEKRCSSDGGDGPSAPWRRNRSRARSVIPLNQSGITNQESALKTVDESLMLITQEVRSVEVKAIDEVSSLASTPFSICQLMTPVIPSRQPTETSEILQGVLSPTTLDLSLRPHSEAKQTPEPSIKRDGYKSLASSILFNLKDNRKRVKSRYSPPKFKTSELPENGSESPQQELLKLQQAGSEGSASGLSTPAIPKDGQVVDSPDLEAKNPSTVSLVREATERPLSDDYLLSNLLHSKRDGVAEQSPMSPYIRRKKIKSPIVKKQNYPSLNLYKKACPLDSDTAYVQAPLSTAGSKDPDQSTEKNELSRTNKDTTSKKPTTQIRLSPASSGSNKNFSPAVSLSTEGPSSTIPAEKTQIVVADKEKQHEQITKDKYIEGHHHSFSKKETNEQLISAIDVIRAAKEAISAVKSKALSTNLPENTSKVSNTEASDGSNEIDKKATYSKEMLHRNMEHLIQEADEITSQIRRDTELSGQNSKTKKEPPPVPKRTFGKPDIFAPLEKLTNGDLSNAKLDLSQSAPNSALKLNKVKHAFSARQNNYIKSQRHSVDNMEDEELRGQREADPQVDMKMMQDEERMSFREMKDSEHIIQDLHALKELEMARLGEHVTDHHMQKYGDFSIDKEAKARNDLISKELKNIKKDMLSMRGNTQAKRELFLQKEGGRQEHFAKVDNNVRVNKALLNDNYDKAKMALEEIISEREKRKSQWTELDAKTVGDGSSYEDTCRLKTVQHKSPLKTLKTEEERQNGSTLLVKDDLKERLGDLRDHNHMRQILSQAEPGRDNEPNTNLKTKAKKAEKVPNRSSFDSEDSHSRWEPEQNESKNSDAPPVPPRGKKAGNRKDAGVAKKAERNVAEEKNMFSEELKQGSWEVQTKGKGLARQEVDNEIPSREVSQIGQIRDSCYKEKPDVGKTSDLIPECESVQSEAVTPRKCLNSVDEMHLKEFLQGEVKKPDLRPKVSPSVESTFKSWDDRTEETSKAQQTVPENPNHFETDEIKNLEESEDTDLDLKAVSETRDVMSPLSLVNGVCTSQSPPDQASLSSKSSYFSVESALQRNTESESNVYHSLENLIVEVDEASCMALQDTKSDADRAEVHYDSSSDHEDQSDAKTQQKEKDVPYEEDKETPDQSLLIDDLDQTPVSPCSTLSPPLGIPALFKVKDNTFSNRVKKSIQPWSPRASLSVSEKVGEELQQRKDDSELSLSQQPDISISEEISEHPTRALHSPPPQPNQSPFNNQRETLKKSQFGEFLTVPAEDDRLSGQSVSSEGVESLTVSTDLDEQGMNVGVADGQDLLKVQSEWSGSTCSGTESQTGLPKPPTVLPKSEKAVLKAMKLTNRRIKKEAQKNPHKSSQSKHRAERQKSEKTKTDKDLDREKKEDIHQHGKSCAKHHDRGDRLERRGRNMAESTVPSHDSLAAGETDRQGRSVDKRTRNKPEPRHYSSDRIISNVPVYKAQVNERRPLDKNLLRSQSIDRYLEGRVERRLSTDSSVSEKLEPRSQRIEKSIMNELQQRGRSRDKVNRDNVVKRSQSIDAYSADIPNSSTLSRQSSQTSQLSRQSSVEHALVTQSFPMTQRKLLQDPDSGQFFFVDMPIQIKTKTFFDPETGSYVQLPVQPPEGAVPQAPPLEVLTPPLVVYHSFVPVSLSPMAHNATIQPAHKAPEEQMHSKEMHQYLEPTFAHHDYMLGEFLGTEELDCPS